MAKEIKVFGFPYGLPNIFAIKCSGKDGSEGMCGDPEDLFDVGCSVF